MLTSNNQLIQKHEVIAKLRRVNQSKFDVWDIVSKEDHKKLSKHIEKLTRNEVLSVVVITGQLT